MEKAYQYFWHTRMFGRKMCDVSGSSVEVLDPGRHNTDAGPDFFNSKVCIGGEHWAGNVEIHVRASDWFRHGHDTDPAYDTVILHVVGVSDRRVGRPDGSLIPQVEITLPEDYFKTFSTLSGHDSVMRCREWLGSLPPLAVTDWLESLAVERLQAKAGRVADTLANCGGDWEQTCFVTLARALGFGLNGDPFEMLARSLPLKYLHHHSDNPMQIQALLFGQAAMLDSSSHIFDEYYQQLCREYYFLARKYGLRPMRREMWKYARTRPQNFPHRRIALLAKSCEGGFAMFSRLRDAAGDVERLRGLFDWELTGYWRDNFDFDRTSPVTACTLSEASVNLMLVNAVVPLLYAYASHTGDADLAERAGEVLEQLPPERNSVIREWQEAGIEARTSFRTQALLHLRREYCEARKCLYCRFGHRMLRRTVAPSPTD